MHFNKLINSFKRDNPMVMSQNEAWTKLPAENYESVQIQTSFRVVRNDGSAESFSVERFDDIDSAARHFAKEERAGEPVKLYEVTVPKSGVHGPNDSQVIALAGDEQFQCREPRPHLIEAIEAAREECRQSFRM